MWSNNNLWDTFVCETNLLSLSLVGEYWRDYKHGEASDPVLCSLWISTQSGAEVMTVGWEDECDGAFWVFESHTPAVLAKRQISKKKRTPLIISVFSGQLWDLYLLPCCCQLPLNECNPLNIHVLPPQSGFSLYYKITFTTWWRCLFLQHSCGTSTCVGMICNKKCNYQIFVFCLVSVSMGLVGIKILRPKQQAHSLFNRCQQSPIAVVLGSQ